jgi:hypothetical protein
MSDGIIDLSLRGGGDSDVDSPTEARVRKALAPIVMARWGRHVQCLNVGYIAEIVAEIFKEQSGATARPEGRVE